MTILHFFERINIYEFLNNSKLLDSYSTEQYNYNYVQ